MEHSSSTSAPSAPADGQPAAPKPERHARLVTEIVQLPPDPDSDDSDDERNAAVDRAPTDGDGAPDDDFLASYPADTEELHLQHLRLENSSLPPLRLPRFTQLQRLCLRQNELSSPLSAECLELGALEDLDLYDNRLGPRVEDEELKGVAKVT